MMKRFIKKQAGYRVSHRNRWLLISSGTLTFQEFLLFEYYLDAMDFDLRHRKFGTFEVFLDELVEIFGKTADTIRNWHNGLLDKGFIGLVDKRRRLYRIKSPLRYITGQTWGGQAHQFARNERNNQSLELLLENTRFFPIKPGLNPKHEAVLALKNDSKALSFSKDKSKVNQERVVIGQEVRSDEEYQRIYDEDGFEYLTPDDMQWIDRNIKEKIVVENKEMERNIVKTFFNGNWNKYRKNLNTSQA